MKIDHVIGNRPHFIKLMPVIRAMKKKGMETPSVIHSGQHYDHEMSGQFLSEFGIEPDFRLDVGSLPHGAQTGRMMEQLETHWQERRPAIVVVYGDTNTTLAAALTAIKMDIPVAHVEAGPRATQLCANLPEEVNRRIIDTISTWLYTPTDKSADNLRRENIAEERIINVGDVMYDVVIDMAAKMPRDETMPERYAASTLHRSENTDDRTRLLALVDGFCAFAKTMPIYLPLHPRTRAALEREGLYEKFAASVNLLEPLGHKDMLHLIRHCELVISDSGGVPKEAAFLGKRSVILRREPVWDELSEQGWSTCVEPTDAQTLHKGMIDYLDQPAPSSPIEGFGNADAADRIAEHLRSIVDGQQ